MGKLRSLLEKKEVNPEIEKNLEFEKNDFLAMFIASATVFIPVVIAAFAVIAIMILLLFYR